MSVYIRWSVVVMFCIILISIFYFTRTDKLVTPKISDTIEIAQQSLVVTSPLNTTYTVDGESVTLREGRAVSLAAEGSLLETETRIFGEPIFADINIDGVADAVLFLTQNTGGTGTFFYVVAAIQKDKTFVGTNSVFLGDRIAPQNITVENGVIMAHYADRKPTDSFATAPSVGMTKFIVFNNGMLGERQ